MGVVITPESELGKELQKWNKPYRYEEYPRMLYRARRTPDGRLAVADPYSEAFTASCQTVVNNEDEERKRHNEGFRRSQKEAMEHGEGLERDIANAAAARHAADRRMSAAAQAEAAAADADTAEHLPEIPDASKRKRGRRADA